MRYRRSNPGDEYIRGLQRRVAAGDLQAAVALAAAVQRTGGLPSHEPVWLESHVWGTRAPVPVAWVAMSVGGEFAEDDDVVIHQTEAGALGTVAGWIDYTIHGTPDREFYGEFEERLIALLAGNLHREAMNLHNEVVIVTDESRYYVERHEVHP